MLLLTLVGAGKSLSCSVPQLPFCSLNVLSWLNLPFLGERNVVLADFLYQGMFSVFPNILVDFPSHLREVSLQLQGRRLNILWGLGSTGRQLGLSVFLLLQHRHHDELSSAKAHGLENKVLDYNMPHKVAWPKSGVETWKH